jgi:aryl-alcohol dehydrogenase-like predicted oxidoreductase
MTTITRALGRSGITVSALGMGCWAIGGPSWAGAQPLGWGKVDDEESVRAIHRAVDLGVTFFDTADLYGAGRSERVLGRALGNRRDEVVIATKWGNTFNEETKQWTGSDASPEHIPSAVRASLSRLNTDRIDLYQLHLDSLSAEQALELVPTLEDLVTEGLVRSYGWSTDYPAPATEFAKAGVHATAIQHDFSVLKDSPGVLAVCEQYDLASINRGPLGMGLLTGKYTADSTLGADDVRGAAPEWMDLFRDGHPAPEWLARVDAVREILRNGGRTLAQGALGYLWGRSSRTVPIPGCRTPAQVEENAGALEFGPLTADQVAEVDSIIGR